MPAWLALVTLLAAGPATVSGVVRDSAGLPLPDASVYVAGTQRLTHTDATGRFELEAAGPGALTLIAFRDGFKPARAEVTAGGEAQDVVLVLEPAQVTESVTVLATTPSDERRLRPIDVVSMPGAEADVMRVLQGLAGVVSVDDGAGLFVRGGDQSEVLVSLDGARLFHPYRFETATGGLYGTFEPFLLEGLSFSSGGFSARYGNALSAVLDLAGLRRPARLEFAATAGLAAASTQLALPVGQRAGLRFSGNRTFTKLLFQVNGQPQRFSREPEGWDANVSAHYESPRAGTFKVFAMRQRDDVGVLVEREAFAGFLTAGSTNRLYSATWDKFVGRSWRASASAGDSKYVRQNTVGVVDIDLGDRRRSARVDLTGPGGPLVLRTGLDLEQATVIYAGHVPAQGGDLGGVEGTEDFEVLLDDWRVGAYVEGERTFGRFTPVLGARVDRFDLSRAVTVDPRLNLAVALGPRQRIRVAWGLYRQAPGAEYYDTERGARRLPPMRARHFIVGWERGGQAEKLHVRAEAYRKDYVNLPVTSAASGYDASGYGWAQGLDLYARRRWRRLDLRANYSWLEARRRWTPSDQNLRFNLPSGAWPPDFDLPHTVQASLRFDATPRLSFGAAWRLASGRPYTPVIGATARGSRYSPIYGPINSGRLPRYERWDASASYSTRAAGGRVLFFLAGNNLLARRNAFEYKYNADFTRREPIVSAAPRTFYFGVSMSR